MSPVPVETFKTDAIPIGQRLTYWNDVAARTFGDIAVDAARTDFAACMRRSRFDQLTLADVVSSPARVHGGRNDACNPAPGWFILLNERGHSRLSQRGREVSLLPGQLTVLRADEKYCIDFTNRNRTIVLHLPGDRHPVDFAGHIARSHSTESTALIASFMRRLAALEADSGRGLEPLSLSRLALDLTLLTWPIQPDDTTRKSMTQWRQHAFSAVERRLVEPGLNAQAIALELRVSTRFVQLIFASSGQTVSDCILTRRLERAAALLRADNTASISDIALAVGFNDLSHFCRRFRQRFGASARQFRSGDE